MVAPSDLIDVAANAARRRLPAHSLDHVEIAPMTASDGGDALRVSVVLAGANDEALPGDLLMDTSLAVAWAIERAGDHRYAFVEYRWKDGGDPDDDPAA